MGCEGMDGGGFGNWFLHRYFLNLNHKPKILMYALHCYKERRLVWEEFSSVRGLMEGPWQLQCM